MLATAVGHPRASGTDGGDPHTLRYWRQASGAKEWLPTGGSSGGEPWLLHPCPPGERRGCSPDVEQQRSEGSPPGDTRDLLTVTVILLPALRSCRISSGHGRWAGRGFPT